MGHKRTQRRYFSCPIDNVIRYLLAAMVGAIVVHVCTFFVYESAFSSQQQHHNSLDFLRQTDEYEITTTEDTIIMKRKVTTTTATTKGLANNNNQEEERQHWAATDSTILEEDNNVIINITSELLPERLFTVVGLESSGTTFLADTLAKALGLDKEKKIKDNSHETLAFGNSSSYYHYFSEKKEKETITEVQHVSLPWGSLCNETLEPWRQIVPVVYPHHCMSTLRFRKRKWFHPMTDAAFRKRLNDNPCFDLMTNATIQKIDQPPGRYFLNVTSHFEWYRRRGIDMYLIIVVRDESISKEARAKHCRNRNYLEREELVGMTLIEHAIDHYILNNNNKRRGMGASSSSLLSNNNKNNMMASTNGKVLVVSYEILNRLQDKYLQQIYNYLGINSTFNPEWQDGNTKYIIKKSDQQENDESNQ